MLVKTIVENSLIIAAEAFWIFSSWSQLRRLVKTRNRKGLSAPNQTLNAAGNIAWIAYFASQALPVPVLTNLITFTLTVATLAYTLGNRKQFLRGIVAIALVAPLTSYVLIAYSSVSGWVGVIYNLIASLPWVIHVVTSKKTSGISEKSLLFAYSAMLATLTYALLIGSLPLQVGTCIGLLNMTIVTTYYYRYRHEAADKGKEEPTPLPPAF